MFDGQAKKIFKQLGNSQIMCLATSDNERVTARSMSFAIINQRFYFQTAKQLLKYQQI